MEYCQFELTDQVKAYGDFRPIPPPELVEIIIDYLSKEVDGPFGTAVDVCCGSGQSTVVLYPYFKAVLGLDISRAQIRETLSRKQPFNVKYQVGSATYLPLPDKSVHLVTAATCLHWLDKEMFFKEAKRVLAPGGILAVYASCALYPVTEEDSGVDLILRQLTDKILYDDMKMYRSPCVYQALEQYRNVFFPFDEVIRIPNLAHRYKATADHAAGYIRSMSTFQNFKKSHPLKAEHMLGEYQQRIMELIGKSSRPEDTPLKYLRKYFLILCQNGTQNTSTQKTEPVL